ncbi:phospholipase A2-like [Diachasmimorpha longicaudata]|uniref:phospholipase A2-like n=1 Tax=Diachasmimorpha longicaudata TaxID=58733 RepID=UPI0030B91169
MNNSIIAIFLVCLVYVIAENESDLSDLGPGIPLSPTNDGTKKKSWGVIYPGTKWCGQGNKAKNDSDLGRYKRTDSCCRDHDRCPDKIKGGTSKHGIQNNGTVTILSCQCDDIFFDCLKGVHTKTSKIVGTLYFDIVKNKCFKQSEEDREKYILTKSRKFSRNRFIKLVGKMIG